MPNLRKKLPSANALFVFEAAARCGNFTRAAQELYVSQPAVSRMLARMEDHLGVRLFERVRGGIELTENGRILYRKISEGFSGIEGAIREIEARDRGGVGDVIGIDCIHHALADATHEPAQPGISFRRPALSTDFRAHWRTAC